MKHRHEVTNVVDEGSWTLTHDHDIEDADHGHTHLLNAGPAYTEERREL